MKMNAGTRFGEMADALEAVEIFHEGAFRIYTPAELGFGYRKSHLPQGGIVTRVKLKLKERPLEEIRKKMAEVDAARKGQPKRKSAGCAFKNPPGQSAGRLIDERGLKGLRVGDAWWPWSTATSSSTWAGPQPRTCWSFSGAFKRNSPWSWNGRCGREFGKGSPSEARMGFVRLLLASLLLATLYVASLVLFPVEEVEVVGLKHLKREDVLARVGLHRGSLALGGPFPSRPPPAGPWVAEARLEKPRPGAVRLVLRERTPFLPLADGSALAQDGTLLPGGAPWAQGPRVEGRGPLPKADLLALARAFPKAKRLRYTPAGYWVEGEGLTLFAPKARFLLEYAQAGAPLREGHIYLYSWGVSVGP